MRAVPYKIIKTRKQYFEYCSELEGLLNLKKTSKLQRDIIELLTLLIEKWDNENNSFNDTDPVTLLKYLMNENKVKAVDLAESLGISKSLVSDILNYRRGLSKDVIRKLSERFKVSQDAFNKPYKLVSPVNAHLKNARVMNTPKKLSRAS